MNRRALARLGPLVLLLPLAAPAPGSGQIRASEAGSVSQTIDGTTITLEYSRPSARGRALFGALVPWDVVWTPGANWATTLETNRALRLNGVQVPAGAYSVWMIPREGPWTLTLNPEPRLFHFQKPDSTGEQIHVEVRPETAPHSEMLTWSFPTVVGDAAVLTMRWGTTSVPVNVAVQPTKVAAMTPEELERYVGEYDLTLGPGLPWPSEGRLVVFEEDGRLRGRLPFPIHPEDETAFDLVPAGTDRFNPGLYRSGELFGVEPGLVLEFVGEEGPASRVRLLGGEGSPFGEGERAG